MISRDTITRLEFDRILAEIARHAGSDVSRCAITELTPLIDPDAIRLTAGQISEIRSLTRLDINLRLDRYDDIRPFLERVRPIGAFLAPCDLLAFIPVFRIFRDLASQFKPRNDIPLLKTIDPQPAPFPDILEPLQASIDQDGAIMDGASPQLAEIRRAKRGLAARIRKKIEEIIRASNIEIFLQDDFITQRSGRWVIPVRMDSKGMVKGVVHDVSASGETAFMEPLEIIPFVNELENLAAEEKAEEIRILRRLSAWIREDAAAIGACFDSLVLLDVLASGARFADEFDMEPPDLNREGVLRLRGARHPLLLMQQRQGLLSRVEPLNLELGDAGRVMVITGPNAGGKTIALKTAGVLTLMALCGLPIPAGPSSSIPLADTLLVDIGDEQSIEQSLSTFSAHVARISSILDQAGPRSLVLLDELGAGTEPHQGAAIACAVIGDLMERGASVIATTHLADIVGFVHRTPGMINAGMEFDGRTFTPLYRLVAGEPGQSHALDIARRYGLPERVSLRARELLGSGGEEFSLLLAELRQRRVELEQAHQGLERREQRLDERAADLETRAREVEQIRRDAAERAWQDARELISATRRRMNELLDELKRGRRNEVIEKIRQAESELTGRLAPQPVNSADAALLQDIEVGDRVRLLSLGHDALVLQVDARHGRARVQAGSMELEVALNDLSARNSSAKSAPKVPAGNWKADVLDEERHELKLIGLRVDEALDLLEPFLNHSALAGTREVRIIHGMGTGRLRQAVREHLERHPLVQEYRSGAPHEGRDGATVVTLRQ